MVSSGGHKGWGFGLMAEILASALTGTTPSRDVKGLKLADAPPHDLGQFFLFIDPSDAAGFAVAVTALGSAVAQDPGCRMPGQGKTARASVSVPDALWTSLNTLREKP